MTTTGVVDRADPPLRPGVGLHHFGDAPQRVGVEAMAVAIEQAGFDIWFSDHVVLVDGAVSPYPFSPTGEFFLPADGDWYDFVTTAAYVAALTSHSEIGVGVAVPALRNPVELAVQLATLDRLAGGRVRVGVGAGWLIEEFTALGLPEHSRGARLDAVIDVMRAVWTGRIEAEIFGPYVIPHAAGTLPAPVRAPPIYVGGTSPAALRRLVERGDAWLGMAPNGRIDPADVATFRSQVHDRCLGAGREPASVEIALRIGAPRRAVESGRLASQLRELREAGVQRFVFDIAWREEAEARDRLQGIADASGAGLVADRDSA